MNNNMDAVINEEAKNGQWQKLKSEQDKKEYLKKYGLDVDDPGTFKKDDPATKEKVAAFNEDNPGYEVLFETRSEVEHFGYGGCNTRFNTTNERLVVAQSGMYEDKMVTYSYTDDAPMYTNIVIKPGKTETPDAEMPFNVASLIHTFSDSHASVINVPGWDISKLVYVSGLFSDNSIVKEINMSGWKYPKEKHGPLDLPRANFSSMFRGCTSLQKLRFTAHERERRGEDNCFKGCENLEYVYFEEGSESVDMYIDGIIKNSKKPVTIDGVFSYGYWLTLHGGMDIILCSDPLTVLTGDSKFKLVEVKPRDGINFIGKLESIPSTLKEYAAALFEKGKIDKQDYETYMRFLKELVLSEGV
jgi:hypothetical protein